MNTKRVLIIGSFSTEEGALPTQAMELAELLSNNQYSVLTVSRFSNRLIRLFDIVSFIYTQRRNFDVAIVQFYSGSSLVWQHIACSLVKRLGKKLVITVHGGGVPARMKKFAHRYLQVLKKADVITCPSNYLIEQLSKYQLPATLVENSIELAKYPFYDKREVKPVLLWMRAFSDIYNPLMAVRVVHRLKQVYPDVKMYMAGPDLGLLQQVKQLTKELNLEQNIEFIGYVDFKGKVKLAEQVSIYLSTNKIDNAPVTFTEMWAMGLPVVSTNAGGVPYLAKDCQTALLADVNDDDAMTQKIVTLLNDNILARRLIENGKAASKKHDRATVFNKWHQLLNSL